MSRLDSNIRRLMAQRDGIAWAAEEIRALPGAILEVGLGNGRTYDHIRETLPERDIWVIDRAPSPHPKSKPPDDRLLVMDAEDAFERLKEMGVSVAFAHYDIGIGVPTLDHPIAERLSPGLAALLAPGAAVMANNPLHGLERVDGPSTVARDRYYFYRK